MSSDTKQKFSEMARVKLLEDLQPFGDKLWETIRSLKEEGKEKLLRDLPPKMKQELSRKDKPEFLSDLEDIKEKMNSCLLRDWLEEFKEPGRKKYDQVYEENWYQRWDATEMNTDQEEIAHKAVRVNDYARHHLGMTFGQLKRENWKGILAYISLEQDSLIKEIKKEEEKSYKSFYFFTSKQKVKNKRMEKIEALRKKTKNNKPLYRLIYNIQVRRLFLMDKVGKAITTLENDKGNIDLVDSPLVKKMLKKDTYDSKYLGDSQQINEANRWIQKVLEQSKSRENNQRLESLKDQSSRDKSIQGIKRQKKQVKEKQVSGQGMPKMEPLGSRGKPQQQWRYKRL